MRRCASRTSRARQEIVRVSFGSGWRRKDGAGDDAERAERAGGQFRQIVARNVLDDFAAAAGQRAVGQGQRHADDQVAQRAEAKAQRAAVVRGKHAANGGAARPQSDRARGAVRVCARVSCRCCIVQPASTRDREIGPGMLDDCVEARGGQNDVGALRRIAPGQFCASAARELRRSPASFASFSTCASSCSLARCDDELRLHAGNGVFRRWRRAHVPRRRSRARRPQMRRCLACCREETPASIVRSAPRFRRSRAVRDVFAGFLAAQARASETLSSDSRAAVDRTRSARVAWFAGRAR